MSQVIFGWLGYRHDSDETEGEKRAGPWFEILPPSGSVLWREGPSSDWKILSSATHLGAGFRAFSAEIEGHLHVRVLENETRLAREPVGSGKVRGAAPLKFGD
jgi:hypothetical protein